MLSAIAATLTIVALGHLLKRVDFMPDGVWQSLARLCYWVLFPALLFELMVSADLNASFVGAFILALAAGCTLITLYAVLAARFIGLDGPATGSLIQGALRHNGFLVLSIVHGAFGTVALQIGAIAIAFLVPVSNIVSVIALLICRGTHDGGSLRSAVVAETARNPLLASILVGGLVNWFGIPVPEFLNLTAEFLGAGALPLLLLSIGASLQFSGIRGYFAPMGIAVLAKLMIFPAVLVSIGAALGLEPLALAVLAAVGAAPTATSSFALASELGGDTRLMAGIISSQTLMGAISMPLWIWLSPSLSSWVNSLIPS